MNRLMIIACAAAMAAAASRSGAADAPEAAASRVSAALEGLKSRFLAERERAVDDLLELAKTDPSTVGDGLMPLLDDADARVRLMALRILGKMRHEPVLDKLCDMALNAGRLNVLEQSFVIEALTTFGKDAEGRLAAKDAARTEEGRRILGRIALDDVLEYIKSFYEDGDGTPGWYEGQFDGLKGRGKPAVYALMLIAESYFTADPPFLKGLNAYGVRWYAIYGLGEMKDKDALPLLRRIVRDVESALAAKQSASANLNLDEEASRAAQTAAVACYKTGDREPLLERIRDMRSRIDGRSRSNPRSYTERLLIASMYWDLALSLATIAPVEDVVDAYKKYMYWRKRGGDEEEKYAIGQYNIACAWSRAGRLPEALDAYLEAVKMGYEDVSWTLKDGDLSAVRELPEFQLALAYIPLSQLRREPEILPGEREKKIAQAMSRMIRAVEHGLSDPKWFEDPRFAAMRRRAGYWWCAARVYARAGNAARTAESIVEFAGLLELSGDDGTDPDDLERSADLDKVRDDPAVKRALDALRQRQ